jgi:predicted nuclease with TOPRIM domain
MSDLSPEEQTLIREAVERLCPPLDPQEHDYGAICSREEKRSLLTDALTEQALSHAREKEELQSDCAAKVQACHEVVEECGRLRDERDELKRQLEKMSSSYDGVCQEADDSEAEVEALSEEVATLKHRVEELESQAKVAEGSELFWHCIDCGEEVGEDDSGYWFHKHRSDGPISFDHEANPMPSMESIRTAFSSISIMDRARALSRLTGAPKEG